MLGMIRDTLRNKRSYEAESKFLHDRDEDLRCKLTNRQNERMRYLDERLNCIQTWLALLTEDEAYVVKRHLIDGIDIPRITKEYQKRWGDEYAKTERTIKAYQRRALNKIVRFEQTKQMLIKE